ncbi:MAG: peptide chain release factor N(5)-glutamine methyltransferase [Desulfitobacteriia bacterium]|jgi:release factor glutamine methyltransferase
MAENIIGFNSYQVLDLLKSGTEYLKIKGVEHPRVEADLILAHVLEKTRAELYLEREREVALPAVEEYAEFLVRRGNREPLAYLLGKKEFMGLDFFVDQRVLIPRPETELLVEKVIATVKRRPEQKRWRILDLGTGSGVLAISLAYFLPQVEVTAVDVSKAALDVACLNAHRLDVKIDFQHGDLFEGLRNKKFDIVVSNPPYISFKEYYHCAPEVKKEPILALLGGFDGLSYYRKISDQVAEFLNPKGLLFLEIGCSQGRDVADLFERRGFKTKVIPDYAGLDRILQAEKE